jgi:tetrahydromethanopterin S-methyltransferase subunit G
MYMNEKETNEEKFNARLDITDQKIDDVLNAVNQFASHTEERFQKIDTRLDGMDKRFDGMDKRFDRVDGRLDGVDDRMDRMETTMVTKDYLDDKLADLKGDIITVVRKEDTKVVALISILRTRNVLTKDDEMRLLAMAPFPDLRAVHRTEHDKK